MTEKQKKAFLKAEGWRPYKVSDGTYGIDGWRDTKEKHVLESLAPIEFAYRIAYRRKRQREARKLKAAGWHWRCASRFHAAKAGYVHADYRGRYTRQEALQTLDAQP